MPKAGDVFSINIGNRYAYFQFFGRIKPMGDLIRILPGIYSKCPSNLQDLTEQNTNFWTFFSLSHGLKQGLIRKETHCKIPDHSQKMPIFRNGTIDPQSGVVDVWWLWDGQKSWKIGKLSEEQKRYPILGAWDSTMLIKRISQYWLPERDPR